MVSDLAQLGLVRTTGLSSWLIRTVTRSHWNHVVIRVSPNFVISAETDGVAELPVETFPDAVWSSFDLSVKEQNKIIAFALAQDKKPYGVLTYLWIGVSRITRWATPNWLEQRISDQHTWICSQLADAAYQAGGWHLFRDDRPAGAVVPGDIAKVMYDFGMVGTA